MLVAAGLSNPTEIQRKYILHRLDPCKMVTYIHKGHDFIKLNKLKNL